MYIRPLRDEVAPGRDPLQSITKSSLQQKKGRSGAASLLTQRALHNRGPALGTRCACTSTYRQHTRPPVAA